MVVRLVGGFVGFCSRWSLEFIVLRLCCVWGLWSGFFGGTYCIRFCFVGAVGLRSIFSNVF